jgi:ABC-type branched-subunit amino acid transport system substrate-binding protein
MLSHARKYTAALITTAALVALTACSGSGADTPSDSAAPDTSPIKLMVIESMTGAVGIDQTAPLGAEAAAEAINAAGGVNGRDIEVIACDTASDPNKASECARAAIDDGVAAVVGSFDPINSSVFVPILEAGGVPYIMPLATQPIEMTTPVSFPGTGGTFVAQYGMAQLAIDADCSTAAVLGDNTRDQGRTAARVDVLVDEGIDATMIDVGGVGADVAPIVAQALEGNPDCILYAADGQLGVKLFTGFRKAGSDAQFITATGSLLPPFLQAMGDAANGMLALSELPALDDPDLADFHDQMTEYQPDVRPVNFTLYGWLGVQAFNAVAQDLEAVDAASVLAAFSETTDLQVPGLPALDFTEAKSETYPRLFNSSARYFVVENGQYVPSDDEWHEVVIP